jgi:hypothetical protein
MIGLVGDVSLFTVLGVTEVHITSQINIKLHGLLFIYTICTRMYILFHLELDLANIRDIATTA